MAKEAPAVNVRDLDSCPNCGAGWKYQHKHPDDEKSSVAGQTLTYSRLCGVEYDYTHPQRYDGVSEWYCPDCRTRWGRWSMKVLKDGEFETRFGGQ